MDSGSAQTTSREGSLSDVEVAYNLLRTCERIGILKVNIPNMPKSLHTTQSSQSTLDQSVKRETVNSPVLSSVGYRVDHRCIVCMRIKYTRGDHEIRPEWSAIYIILVGGKVLRFAVCGLRFAVASCGCGRNLRLWSQLATVVADC
jgi:hypothetical protein